MATGCHSFALRFFAENADRDIFQKDFEEEFSIRRSTATKILQLMEKNGLIERQKVESDARLKKIVLTNKALDIHKKAVGRPLYRRREDPDQPEYQHHPLHHHPRQRALPEAPAVQRISSGGTAEGARHPP